MADRHTADTITDDELDQLYARVAAAEEASRRFLAQRQEMAEERYVWQQRAEQAEDAIARVVAITEEHPAGIDTALILAALDTPQETRS